jgi:hypothetical protein
MLSVAGHPRRSEVLSKLTDSPRAEAVPDDDSYEVLMKHTNGSSTCSTSFLRRLAWNSLEAHSWPQLLVGINRLGHFYYADALPTGDFHWAVYQRPMNQAPPTSH